MGKNKEKKGKHGKHGHAEVHFDVPPQVAGIAAAALRRVNTPAFQQLIATSLGAAGQAIGAMAQRSAAERGAGVPPTPPGPPSRPTPPAPPTPPEPPVTPGPEAAYRPRFEAGSVELPPQAAEAIERVAAQAAQAIEGAAASASKAIETAAAAFEQWVANSAKPKPPSE